MTGPEADRLRRVLSALATHLDDDVDGLTREPHLAAGRDALDRLADPAHLAALDGLPAEEADWLARELERLWGQVGRVVVEPAARVEVDADGPPTRLVVRVDGLEPGWTVAWSGARGDADDPATATWEPDPDRHDPTVTARVTGRGATGRVLLVAHWRPEV